MQKSLVSIIIPVYNTPIDVLKRCFGSIQIINNISYEVIIIDDGSTDEVGSFCKNYVRGNEDFSYIHQKNSGVSSARNAGIQKATGNYVMFVDADDRLTSSQLSRDIFDKDADIIFFDVNVEEGRRSSIDKVFPETIENYVSKQMAISAACNNKVNSACGKLFRRTLLLENDIFFDTDMVVAEDAKFVLNTILAAKIFYYVPVVVYRYIHDFSSGNKRLARFPEKILKNSITLYKIRKKCLENDEVLSILNEHEIRNLNVAICDLVIRDLFEATGSLLIMGITCNEVKAEMMEVISDIRKANYYSLSAKTKLKCDLLWANCYAIIWALAWLREIYIRIKR